VTYSTLKENHRKKKKETQNLIKTKSLKSFKPHQKKALLRRQKSGEHHHQEKLTGKVFTRHQTKGLLPENTQTNFNRSDQKQEASSKKRPVKRKNRSSPRNTSLN
jgi:hypothetical protein